MPEDMDKMKRQMQEAAKKAEKKEQEAAKKAEKKAERDRSTSHKMKEAMAKATRASAAMREGTGKKEEATEETAVSLPTEHTVAAGETLSSIAAQYYGDQNEWPKIYRANQKVIGEDPNTIRPGQVFKIPA